MNRNPHRTTVSKRLGTLHQRNAFLAAFNAGKYSQALNVCLSGMKQGAFGTTILADAAVCCLRLDKFAEAMAYGLKAHALDPDNIYALDTIAEAAGRLDRWDEVSEYGRRALEARDRSFGKSKPSERPLQTRSDHATRKLIAFSLFGANSTYCEPAVLNALEQPRLYPGWSCRFYVDESVPAAVRRRLASAGAELIDVDARLKCWPKPMWRFAAYDDPTVARVIFRDADSVISEREAGAVREWIESGRRFHVMRDASTHTELILAGLWGVVAGALPNMADLVADFCKRPLDSLHFADQFFLREFVWPFARQDVLQHDSVFGFMEGRAFPEGPRRSELASVGFRETTAAFNASCGAADGSTVLWQLIKTDASRAAVTCEYAAIAKNKTISASIPRRYALKLQAGELALDMKSPAL